MVLGRKKEDQFFRLFKDFAETLDKMGSDFGEIINHYHNVERAIADMKMTESECDVKSHAILDALNESFITPLYYYLVAITYSFVHDAILFEILWIGSHPLPLDGFQKAPTTALCIIVDQLDTA